MVLKARGGGHVGSEGGQFEVSTNPGPSSFDNPGGVWPLEMDVFKVASFCFSSKGKSRVVEHKGPQVFGSTRPNLQHLLYSAVTHELP